MRSNWGRAMLKIMDGVEMRNFFETLSFFPVIREGETVGLYHVLGGFPNNPRSSAEGWNAWYRRWARAVKAVREEGGVPIVVASSGSTAEQREELRPFFRQLGVEFISRDEWIDRGGDRQF